MGMARHLSSRKEYICFEPYVDIEPCDFAESNQERGWDSGPGSSTAEVNGQ